MPRFISITYFLTLILLVIYSYTQVDLNLTLSGNFYYQNLQQILTQIGYFNRPLSTFIYLVLLFSLFIHYLLFLRLIRRNLIKKSYLIKLIAFSTAILFLAYPAFSHDIFNYIFDARIVGLYGLNPYEYKALDFPNDQWVRFMHWTHRTYPYGPFWVVLTLPFYFLGFGKFVLTLLSFKLLFVISYLGSTFLIFKIMTIIKKNQALLSLGWFALNPLILIESLVSPHNEITMLTLTLASIYLLMRKKVIRSFFLMLLAGGIKFISWIYIPIIYFINKDQKNIEKYLKILLFLTALLLAPVVYLRELYPWYIIPILGLGSFLLSSKILNALLIGFSFGSMLQYIPYLYTGEYSQNLRLLQYELLIIGTLIALIFAAKIVSNAK